MFLTPKYKAFENRRSPGIIHTFVRYGYIKNHKKTVKNGQTRTRETGERKRSQGFKAKAKKSQLSVKIGQTMGQQKEKLVISKALISSLSSNATLDLVKAQREWKFVLATHSEEAQGVSTRIATLAIRVSSDLI
ncbi:hypothetical protein Tco_1188455 [Tanacetum coccineum]